MLSRLVVLSVMELFRKCSVHPDPDPEVRMPKSVVIDEFHLTVRVPAGVPDAAVRVYRTLTAPRFMRRLRTAVRAAIRLMPELNEVRLSLSR
jgi:hypothetical protein